MVEDIDYILCIADTDNSVSFGELLSSIFLVALNDTSGNDDLFKSDFLLELAQFKDSFYSFFLSRFYKAAGIYHSNISKSGFSHKLIAVRFQLIQHSLRIYQIF